MACDTL